MARYKECGNCNNFEADSKGSNRGKCRKSGISRTTVYADDDAENCEGHED